MGWVKTSTPKSANSKIHVLLAILRCLSQKAQPLGIFYSRNGPVREDSCGVAVMSPSPPPQSTWQRGCLGFHRCGSARGHSWATVGMSFHWDLTGTQCGLSNADEAVLMWPEWERKSRNTVSGWANAAQSHCTWLCFRKSRWHPCWHGWIPRLLFWAKKTNHRRVTYHLCKDI